MDEDFDSDGVVWRTEEIADCAGKVEFVEKSACGTDELRLLGEAALGSVD